MEVTHPTQWTLIPITKRSNRPPHLPFDLGWMVIDSKGENYFAKEGELIINLHHGDYITFAGYLPPKGSFLYKGSDNVLLHMDNTMIKDNNVLHFMTPYRVPGDVPLPSGGSVKSESFRGQIILSWPDRGMPGNKGTLTGTLNVSAGDPP